MTTASARRDDPVLRGAFVMVGFGLAWAVAGWIGVTTVRWAVVVGVVVAVALAALVWRTAVRSRAGRPPRSRRTDALSPAAVGRAFLWINVGQTVLILAAIFVLARLGRPALIPPVVCLVVGLHFLPLARIFDLPLYLWTGGALVVVSAIGFVRYATTGSVQPVLAVVGLLAAATLWATSLILSRTA